MFRSIFKLTAVLMTISCSGSENESASGGSGHQINNNSGPSMEPLEPAITGNGVVNGTVEFEDSFENSGKFLVVRGPDGQLGAAVSQEIGTYPDLVGATAREPTLAQIYTVLHPSLGVPEKLMRLSNEFALMAASPAPEQSPPEEQIGSGTRLLSLSSFNATVCKDHPIDNNYYWQKHTCAFNGYHAQAFCYKSGNLSYAWNDEGATATHSAECHPTQITVSPYTYQWAIWTCTHSPCNWVLLTNSPVDPGDAGVTIHRKVAIIH